MNRRVTRQRREYLYAKALEGKEKEKYEKKMKIRKLLQEGRQVPPELRDEAPALIDEIKLEDEAHEVPASVVDSEYAAVGVKDPKVFLTTSRDPSSRLQQFAKELHFVFPNCQKMNRGKHVLSELIAACRANDVSDLIIVQEHRGEPDGLIVSHLPYGPTAYFGLYNCVLRHDVAPQGTLPTQYPHLVCTGFASALGTRVQTILRSLFPVPKEDSHRIVTFAVENDFISFRHHTYKKEGSEVKLTELGPRFEMKLYQIKLGTLDSKAADVEWVLHPFINSAKRAKLL